MKKQGFTLIELSTVLIIIGLVVGAIMTAQNLLRQAELRKTMTQFTDFKSALESFRMKYNAYPGDMSDADADTFFTAFTWPGNGNGLIGNLEAYSGWYQLTNSGILPGRYPASGNVSDIEIVSSSAGVAGDDMPLGAIDNTGWALQYNPLDGYGAAGAKYLTPVAHVTSLTQLLSLGSINSGTLYPGDSRIPAADAMSLDEKYDDGRPGTGKIRGVLTGNTTSRCASDTDTGLAVYNNHLGNVCRLLFTLW
jgi:prepilin-type N-terminal cleavage/methylation domain-containing protein